MKKVEYSGTSTNHLLNHSWNYSSIDGIIQCFNFSTYRKGRITKKIGAKKIDLQNFSKMELYDIYITVHFTKISSFQNEVYSKPLTYKNGLC